MRQVEIIKIIKKISTIDYTRESTKVMMFIEIFHLLCIIRKNL